MDSELNDFLSDCFHEWLCDSSTTAVKQTRDTGPTQISPSSYEVEEEGLDGLFLGALDAFDTTQRSTAGPSSRPFAAPVSEKDLLQAKQRAVPEKTQRYQLLCEIMGRMVYSSPTNYSRGNPATHYSHQQHWMSRFVWK